MSKLKMAATLAVIGGLAAAGAHQTVSAATAADAQQTVSAPAAAPVTVERKDAPKGTLTVEISGSTTARWRTNCLYAAYASGGTPPYHYSWIGTGLIDGWSDQTATYNWGSSMGNTVIRVDVEDALGATGYAELGVTVLSSGTCD